MKRVGNLYKDIIDIKNIKNMYDKRIRAKIKNKSKIENFERHYVSNIAYVKEILEKKEYKPGKYNIFLIKEPKTRLIMSQNLTDKLINHLVSEYFLVRIFDKTLIDLNVATRINKGTSYGIKKLIKFLKKNKGQNLYILKFDISKYFYNIDHEILKEIIRKKIKDKDALKILDNIIDSTDCAYINEEIFKIKQREINKIKNSNNTEKEKQRLIKEIDQLPYCAKGKSLPIGNLSSQTLAILYLNELDHYILEKLNVDFYERYMDDGILISKDREYLKYCLEKIIVIIKKYKLELNSKTRIYNINEGFEFLGFRYIKKNNKIIIKVKSQTKRKFKRKLKLMNKLYFKGKIKYEDFYQVKMSYIGHLKQGNTKNLIVNSLNLYTRKNNLDELGEFVTI